jgi:SPP1 family predicted phage head-tail adaptor
MSEVSIDPGALNRRLTLEAPDETADGAGGVVRDYESVATLWASVEPIAARGDVDAAQLGATVTHRIVIRYSSDVTTQHRFRDGARVFRIVTIRERDKRWLDIQAEERTV